MQHSTNVPSTAADGYYKAWTLLNQTEHLIQKVRQRELAQAGISVIESAVLFVLANSDGPVTPAEMSRYLLREMHSVSMLLQRMEAKGLITKAKNLHHKHLIRITLTKKGRIAYERSQKLNHIERVLSSLSKTKLDQLDAALRKLRDTAAKELGINHDIRFP